MSDNEDVPPPGSEWRMRGGKVRKARPAAKPKPVAMRPAPKKAVPSKKPPKKKSGRGKGAVSHSRVWLSADKAVAAFWAGAGKSGAEIAEILGGTSGPKVRAILGKLGIRMRRRTGAEELILVRWSRPDHAALQALADDLDIDIEDAAAVALQAILADPAPLLRQLEHIWEHGR